MERIIEPYHLTRLRIMILAILWVEEILHHLIPQYLQYLRDLTWCKISSIHRSCGENSQLHEGTGEH